MSVAPPGGVAGSVEGQYETHVKVEVLGIKTCPDGSVNSVTLKVGNSPPLNLVVGDSVDVAAILPFRNETRADG